MDTPGDAAAQLDKVCSWSALDKNGQYSDTGLI